MNEDIVRSAMKIAANTKKWREFALDIYDLYSYSAQLREDLIVVFMAHPMPIMEGDKILQYTTKLPGKMLTRLNMNGKLNFNLYTHVEKDESNPNKNNYFFLTQTDGINEARSPEGVLPYKMVNDLGEVVKLIRENYI